MSFFQKITESFYSSNQWFFQTPERSLEQAYQSAVKIKSMETEHFGGEKISIDHGDYSDTVISFFNSEINKELNIIKIKLAEFQTSRLVLQNTPQLFLEKLKFIDDIVNRYQSEKNTQLTIYNQPTEMKVIIPEEEPKINVNFPKDVNYNSGNFNSMNKKTGFMPGSIFRTFQRIKSDLNNDNEQYLLNKYRQSRDNTKQGIRFIILLIIIPLLVQQISKNLIFYPVVQNYRVNATAFINAEMKEEAIKELISYKEELEFESFLTDVPTLSKQEIKEKVKEKAKDLEAEFKQKGNNAISNVLADAVGLFVFILVVLNNKPGFVALKNMLNTIVYDLSDSAKAFIIILFTDIFVGFHSSHGWEVILESLAEHLGIAANHNAIFLTIATVPVMLDTILKYWVFRYLNQISPSAVVTLKEMNE
jgi:CemA family